MKITQVTGTAMPLPGDEIDTDRIIPARYLRCVSFDGLGEHAFKDDRVQDPQHPFNLPQFQTSSILISGNNFGCGSSREHAPQSLQKWGIQGIIAVSFAEIFFSNCQALGIPCFRVTAEESEMLIKEVQHNPKLRLTMDVETKQIHYEDEILKADIPEGTRSALVEGTWNATMVLMQAGKAIDATAAKLPYITAFA